MHIFENYATRYSGAGHFTLTRDLSLFITWGGRSDDFRLLSDSVPLVFIDKFVIPRMFRHTYVLTLTLSASKVLQDASH